MFGCAMQEYYVLSNLTNIPKKSLPTNTYDETVNGAYNNRAEGEILNSNQI